MSTTAPLMEATNDKVATGTLTITFYGPYDRDINIDGSVGEAQVERCLVSIYRAAANSRAAARKKV